MHLVQGGLAVDDRGSLSFINDLDLSDFKRFYIVRNHRQGFIRAWHGHKIEAKAAVVLQGSALVCGVRIDNWEKPSTHLEVSRHVLSSDKPSALYFPAGFANGFKSLTEDLIIAFYSTTTLEQSLGDDYRFDSKLWNPWDVEER